MAIPSVYLCNSLTLRCVTKANVSHDNSFVPSSNNVTGIEEEHEKMKDKLLTRTECNVLRGIAIIGIVLHNFCHWLTPVVKENEYLFVRHNADWLWQVCAHPDRLLPAHLLSFFGHYGVPVFLFLSAYGLVSKYERGGDERVVTPAFAFVGRHFLKLFRLMFGGYLVFMVVYFIQSGSVQISIHQTFAMLTMTANVMPDPDHFIFPGPYWFFGLMLQLYIVYRLVLYRRHWGWTVGLVAVCVAVQMMMEPECEWLRRYRYNFMGGMLPFGMGLLFARYGRRLGSLLENRLAMAATLLTSLALTVLLGCRFYGWTFVPAVVCVAAVSLVRLVRPVAASGLAKTVGRALEWTGVLSATLFVIHPTIRMLVIPMGEQGSVYAGLAIYTAASFAVSWAYVRLQHRLNGMLP